MKVLESADRLLAQYSVVFCDIWGVVHNGVEAFSAAIEILTQYRANGGIVILLSNSPRPSPNVRIKLVDLGAAETAFDAIVTSGDATLKLLSEKKGAKLYHIGPVRDKSLLEALSAIPVDLNDADFVLCSGLCDDETETPDDYRDLLSQIRAYELTMYCANPDHIAHRGEQKIYSAGAIAAEYSAIGGQVIQAGKPHLPIYDLAFQVAEELFGGALPQSSILAIGDGRGTDIAGAAIVGIEALYISGGIHAFEYGTSRTTPNANALKAFIQDMKNEMPTLKLAGIQTHLC